VVVTGGAGADVVRVVVLVRGAPAMLRGVVQV
jgi:hypothetical protein